MQLGSEMVGFESLQKVTNQKQRESDDPTLPDISFLSEASFSIEAFENEHKTWTSTHDYASMPAYIQIGMIVLDQSAFLSFLNLKASEGLVANVQALPRCYEYFMRAMINILHPIMEKITFVATTIEEGKLWVARISQLLSSHPWRQLFDSHCKKLKLFREVISRRACDYHDAAFCSSLSESDQTNIRRCEVEWESLFEAFLSCLERVQERDSEQRRILENLLDTTEEGITRKTQALKREFCQELSILNIPEYLDEVGSIHAINPGNQGLLIQKIRIVVDLECEKNELQEHLSKFRTSGGLLKKEERQVDAQKYSVTPKKEEAACQRNAGFEKVSPSKTLLNQALFVIDIRNHITKWFFCVATWNETSILNLDPDVILSQLSQFRRWVSVSLHQINALNSEDEDAVEDSESIIQIPLDTELHSLCIVLGQIREMEANMSIITALKSESFDEGKWQRLPWKVLCMHIKHDNSQQQSDDPARTFREFLTLQTLQTVWRHHKEASSSEKNSRSKESSIYTKESLLEVCKDVNDNDALGKRLNKLVKKVSTIPIMIVPTELLPKDSAAEDGKGLTEFVATSYHIDGLRKASISLHEVCMELRVFRQSHRGAFCSLIEDIYKDVQNRIRLCHNVEDFQKNWLSICEASKLYEIDEFTCRKDQDLYSTSMMGRQVSNRNFESDWKSIYRTWTSWNDCLRHLYLAKEAPLQLKRVASYKVGSVLSQCISQSAKKIASNLKKSTNVKSSLSKKPVQSRRKWRTFDDIWNAFIKFDWEQHVQSCEKALFILDVYFTTCVREKAPRLYCLSNQELLQLMLLTDHEIRESADISINSNVLNFILAKCYSPGLFFVVCDTPSGAMRQDVDWKSHEESDHASSSLVSTIKGVTISVTDQSSSRRSSGMLAFSVPIVLVGRLAFWWVRLEEELYKAVHENVRLLLDQFVPFLGDLESNELERLSSLNVEKKMLISSWISQQEKNTKHPILSQSIVVALMICFTKKMDHTLHPLSALTSSEQNELGNLSNVTDLQYRIFDNLVCSYRDCTTNLRVKVHMDNLLLVCIYYRELLSLLDQAIRDGGSPELIWHMQLRLLIDSKVNERLQSLKGATINNSSHHSLYNSGTTAMPHLKPKTQRAAPGTKAKHQKSSLGLMAFVGDIAIPFGHELVGDYKLSFLTPCTERCLFALWMALRFQNLATFTSSSNSGIPSTADGSGYVNDIRMLLMRWCVRYKVRNDGQNSSGVSLYKLSNPLCRLLHAVVALDGFLLIDAWEDSKHITEELIRDVRCQIEKFRALASQIEHEENSASPSTPSLIHSTAGIWIFMRPARLQRKVLVKSIESDFQTFSVIPPPIELVVTCSLLRFGGNLQDVHDSRIILFLNELLDCEQNPERLEDLSSVFGLTLASSMHVVRHIFSSIDDLKRNAKIYNTNKDESALRKRTRASIMPDDINRDGNVDRGDWILAHQAMLHHAIKSSIHQRLKFLRPSCNLERHSITLLLKTLAYLQQKYLPATTKCRIYEFAKTLTKQAEPISEALHIAATYMKKDFDDNITNVCLDIWRSMQSQMELRQAACDRTSNPEMAVPLGVVVYGNAASGKTTMIKTLHHAICALERIDNSFDILPDHRGRDARTSLPAELETVNPALFGALDFFGAFHKGYSLSQTGIEADRFGLLGRLMNLGKSQNDGPSTGESIVNRRWVHIDANEPFSGAWIEKFITFTSQFYLSIPDTFGTASQRNCSFIFETIDISNVSPTFLWIAFRPVYVSSSLHSYQNVIERWKTSWQHHLGSGAELDGDPMSSTATQLLSYALQMVEVVLADVCTPYIQSGSDYSGSDNIPTFGGISFKYLTTHTLNVLDYVLTSLLHQSRIQANAEPFFRRNGKNSSFLLSSRFNIPRAVRLCCFGILWCLSGHLEEIDRRKFELLVRQKLGDISQDKLFVGISESKPSLYSCEQLLNNKSFSSSHHYMQKSEAIHCIPMRDAFTSLSGFAQMLLSTGRGSFLLFGPRGCGKSSFLRQLMQENWTKLERERDLEVPIKHRQSRSILDMTYLGRLVVDYSMKEHEAAIDDIPHHLNELSTAYDYVFIDNLSLLGEDQKHSSYHHQTLMSTTQFEWIRTLLDHQLCYSHHTQQMESCSKQFGGTIRTMGERDWRPQLTQRFLRHFTLLRVPPLLKTETISILRQKFREGVDIPIEATVPSELYYQKSLSTEEAILRSTIDFIDTFNKVAGRWRMYCAEVGGNCSQSLPILIQINSHHVNDILNRTLLCYRQVSSDHAVKNEKNDSQNLQGQNLDATRLRQLGFAHQFWLTEILQTGYDAWSKIMDSMSKSLMAKQNSRSIPTVEMLRKDQESVRQALRVTSEKYFSMSLSALEGWSIDGSEVAIGGKVSPLQHQEMMCFLHHILEWYRWNSEHTTSQGIGISLSDWSERVCQFGMYSSNRYALDNSDKTQSPRGQMTSESTQWNVLRQEILKKSLSSAHHSVKSSKVDMHGMSEIHTLSTSELCIWLSTDWWQYQLLRFTASLLSKKHIFVLHVRNDRSNHNNLLQPTLWGLVSMSSQLGYFSHAYQVHIDLLRLNELMKLLALTGIHKIRIFLWIRDSLGEVSDDEESRRTQREISTVVLLLKDIFCNQVVASQSWLLKQHDRGINKEENIKRASNVRIDENSNRLQSAWSYIYDEVVERKIPSQTELTIRSFREKVIENLHICIVDEHDDCESLGDSLINHKRIKASSCIKDFVDVPSVRWIVINEETIDSKSSIWSQMIRGCTDIIEECIENAKSCLVSSKIISNHRAPTYECLYQFVIDNLNFWNVMRASPHTFAGFLKSWVCACAKRVAAKKLKIARKHRYHTILRNFVALISKVKARRQILEGELDIQIHAVARHIGLILSAHETSSSDLNSTSNSSALRETADDDRCKSSQSTILYHASSIQSQDDLWALHSRKEEYAMREIEAGKRIRELQAIETKWNSCRAIIKDDLTRALDPASVLNIESKFEQWIELCPWRTLVQCTKMSFSSEMSCLERNKRILDLIRLVKISCKNAKTELLDSTFQKSDTIEEIPAIVERIWKHVFPYITSRRIWESIYLADSWCHQRKSELRKREYLIPVFTDTTGCLLQHFLTHVLAGKSIISNPESRRTVPKEADQQYAFDPTGVMILSSHDTDLEVKLLKAERDEIPVVLLNFRPETKKRLELHFAGMAIHSHQNVIENEESIYSTFSLLVAKTLWSNSEDAKTKYFMENERRLQQQRSRPARLWKKAADLTLASKIMTEKMEKFSRIAMTSVHNQRELRIPIGKKPTNGSNDPYTKHWKPWFQIYAVSMSRINFGTLHSKFASSQVQFMEHGLEWQVEDLEKCFEEHNWTLQGSTKSFDSAADKTQPNSISNSSINSCPSLESSMLLWRAKCDLVDFCMCELADVFGLENRTSHHGSNETHLDKPHLQIGIEKMLVLVSLFAKANQNAEPLDSTVSPTVTPQIHGETIVPCIKFSYEIAYIAITIMLCDQAIFDDKVNNFDKHLQSTRFLQTYPGCKSIRLLQELTVHKPEQNPSQNIAGIVHDASCQYSSPGQQALFRLLWLVIRGDRKSRAPLKLLFRVWAENDTHYSWIDYWNDVGLLQTDPTLISAADEFAGQSGYVHEGTGDSVVSRLRRKLKNYTSFLRRLQPEAILNPLSSSGNPILPHPLQEEEFVKNVNGLVTRVEELWMHWMQFHKDCRDVYLPEIIQMLYLGKIMESKNHKTLSDKVKDPDCTRNQIVLQEPEDTHSNSAIPSSGPGFSANRRSGVLLHLDEHDDFGIEPDTVYSLVRSRIALQSLKDVENTLGNIVEDDEQLNYILIARICIAMMMFPVELPVLLQEYSNLKVDDSDVPENATWEDSMLNPSSTEVPKLEQPNNSVVEFSQLNCSDWQFCSTPTIIVFEDDSSEEVCIIRCTLEYEIFLLSTLKSFDSPNSNVTLFYLCVKSSKDESDLKQQVERISTQAMEKNQQALTKASDDSPSCNVLIFEIEETNHFGSLCGMVSSVVNQHSLLAFPEWYILCPKRIALGLASMDMLTHLKVYQLPKDSDFPLSELLSNLCPEKLMETPELELYDWAQAEHGLIPSATSLKSSGNKREYGKRLIQKSLHNQLEQLLAWNRDMNENGKLNDPLYQIISAEEWEYLDNSFSKRNEMYHPNEEAFLSYNHFIDSFGIFVRRMKWPRKGDEHWEPGMIDVLRASDRERDQKPNDGYQHRNYETPQSKCPKVFREFVNMLQEMNKMYRDSLEISLQLDEKLKNVRYAWVSPEMELRIGTKFSTSILSQVVGTSPTDEPCDTNHHLDFLSICRGFIPPSFIRKAALFAADNERDSGVYKCWVNWFSGEKLQSISLPQLLMLLLGRLRTSIDLALCTPESVKIDLALLWNIHEFFVLWKENYKDLVASTLAQRNGDEKADVLFGFRLEILAQESGSDANASGEERRVPSFESGKSSTSAQLESCVVNGLTLIQERVHLTAGNKTIFYPLGSTRLHIKEFQESLEISHTSVPIRIAPSLCPYQTWHSDVLTNLLPHVWVPTGLLDAIDEAFSGEKEEYSNANRSNYEYEAFKARRIVEKSKRRQSTLRSSVSIPKKFATTFSIGVPILPSQFT
uniref:Uncharacterized protein AlNc14C6G879 n=1 Tax=Albugo laibachii Nc14 TaxID=890382 RepID=F0W1B0_9STRA|nr:conserved hypothetical protein [Albugo laibachii Nc14]|eukprot:CCA14837.1 conserved hypothetical protein [Albugo laibachii Nc14]